MGEISIYKTVLNLCVDSMQPITSSSSSSDSDIDQNRMALSFRKKRTKVKKLKQRMRSSNRLKNYVETIVPKYGLSEFRQHFHVDRKTVENLIVDYTTRRQKKTNIGGWPEITTEKTILITLWYLANNETFKQISGRFDVSLSSAHGTICEFTDYLVTHSNKYIKWPSKQEAITVSKEFGNKEGIPNIIGVIDGCHIRIKKPAHNGYDYINRKGYTSIILQGVTDHRKLFIDISAGAPGSLHDLMVLGKSKLFMQADTTDIFYNNNFYLLGDSAYPLLRWLIPPFKDNGMLSDEQIRFNSKHYSTRMIAEHAFRLLKSRFRRLQNFQNESAVTITKFIVAACVLHNMCILNNDDGSEFNDDAYHEEQQNVPEDDLIDEEIPFLDRRQEILNELLLR